MELKVRYTASEVKEKYKPTENAEERAQVVLDRIFDAIEFWASNNLNGCNYYWLHNDSAEIKTTVCTAMETAGFTVYRNNNCINIRWVK